MFRAPLSTWMSVVVVSLLSAAPASADHCATSAGHAKTSGHAHHDETKVETTAHADVRASKDILDTAVGAGAFETLIAAVKAAGLVETLKGEGPFTVFAPTDEAFAKLPEGTVENLLLPENKEKLVAILTYHVVPGRVTSTEVAKLSSAKTVLGQEVAIAVVDGEVRVDDANVIQTDIDTSNGVIHVIDRVILPES